MKRALATPIRAAQLAMFLAASALPAAEPDPGPDGKLDILFIGNSFTGRHDLSQVVRQMAEAGNPGLNVSISTVIYGGRTLRDHWRLGTANFVRLHELTEEEERATIAELERALEKNPEDSYAKSALVKHRQLLEELGKPRPVWDVVVLQSYRDDLEGETSLYAQYVPKFATLAKAQGAKVILYETTPTTQNAEPLTAAPDPQPVLEKAKAIAAVADGVGAEAEVAPMSLIALRCQRERPDLTLRFINDAHLNQTMAYLSACAIYAAIFERSPQGLPVHTVTDTRYLSADQRDKDRDGEPIARQFSEKDRADLQRIAWEGYREFRGMRGVQAQ